MLQDLDRLIIQNYKHLKTKKDELLCTIFNHIGEKIPADLISFLGLFLGFVSVLFLKSSHLTFMAFWIGYRIADIVDGTFSRLNDKKILRNINVDYLCDNIFSIFIFLASLPIIGTWLPVIAIITYLLHIISNQKLKGTSFFVPRSDYAQFLFLLKQYQLGIQLQIFFTVFFMFIGEFLYKNSKE